jgi:dipeptide/tripeptide permease
MDNLRFLVIGILLLSIGFICELTIRKVSKIKHRIAICITILVVFLLIWAELAVGIFGTPFAGS